MKNNESEIPEVFSKFFEESDILEPFGVDKSPWSEQLRKSLEEYDYRIVAWEQVGEGAVAGVVANRDIIDPVVYILNGPIDLIRTRQTVLGKWDSWDILTEHCGILPNVIAYNRWGNNDAQQIPGVNYSNPNLESFSGWIEFSKEFIQDLYELQRRQWFNVE